MIRLHIHLFPGFEVFSDYFDENKTFGDLKNELIEREIIKKGKYYIEKNDRFFDDDMILKDCGIKKYDRIFVFREGCFKIKVEVKKDERSKDKITTYTLKSEFKVIKLDENNEIKV